MAEWLSLVSLLLLLLVYLGDCSLQFVEECRLKGFTPNLMCSTCDQLDAFNLGVLTESCSNCCQKDQKEVEGPTVTFVKSDRPNMFEGLKIRYARGADPVIKLFDEERLVVETLGIEKWNTESVEEFFREHLHN